MTTPAHPPAGYDQVLARLTAEVRAAQTRALRVVSTGMVQLYWTIGNTILERQAEEGWGTKVVDRLSDDLRKQFPDLKGLGRANIHSMRRFAAAWTWDEVVQQPVGQLPWGHIIELLARTDDPQLRRWYAAQAVEHSWTRAVLHHHLSTGLHDRLGAAPTNFDQHLEPREASRAAQVIKDPYVFDFLALGERATERDLEQALMDRLTETLMELGRGFTFVGRQLRFDVDGEDYFPDLVFFHTDQLRYVVVELKIDRFKPDYAGQLGFCVALVDDTLRNPALHAPTIGLLLCATRSDAVVRYALADYTTRPAEAAGLHLPTTDEIEALVDTTLADTTSGENEPETR
ncbi:PDDEXK nuclease domain-containing protein [Dietzia sp. SL131]|uniref:PDDEXK nuclease domain-containing protein n=1 Tax=Dietzia sp. SL131 TaxID=2995149 RepID=UPI00227B16D4|nr:PDDEXK nuclease domain-containing protein [Dietzia sp. SL131]MCY1659258.1 PDDEXK nuclease domain-containing protein [Dietzia sp. SL131]